MPRLHLSVRPTIHHGCGRRRRRRRRRQQKQKEQQQQPQQQQQPPAEKRPARAAPAASAAAVNAADFTVEDGATLSLKKSAKYGGARDRRESRGTFVRACVRACVRVRYSTVCCVCFPV